MQFPLMDLIPTVDCNKIECMLSFSVDSVIGLVKRNLNELSFIVVVALYAEY